MEAKLGNDEEAVKLFEMGTTKRPTDGAVWQAFALFTKVWTPGLKS